MARTKRTKVTDGKDHNLENQIAIEESQAKSTKQGVKSKSFKNPAEKYRSLDELLGRKTGQTAYAGTEEEYNEKIRHMSMADLEKHALEVGLMPISNRVTLTNRLMREFRKNYSGYMGNQRQTNIQPKNPQKIRELLSNFNS